MNKIRNLIIASAILIVIPTFIYSETKKGFNSNINPKQLIKGITKQEVQNNLGKELFSIKPLDENNTEIAVYAEKTTDGIFVEAENSGTYYLVFRDGKLTTWFNGTLFKERIKEYPELAWVKRVIPEIEGMTTEQLLEMESAWREMLSPLIEYPISFEQIQFWVKKNKNDDFYSFYMKKKNTKGFPRFFVEDPEKIIGHMAFYNPKDNVIYVEHCTRNNQKELKWEFYRIGEGRFEGGIFKPIFPEGTNFAYVASYSGGGNYVIVYLPNILKPTVEDLK